MPMFDWPSSFVASVKVCSSPCYVECGARTKIQSDSSARQVHRSRSLRKRRSFWRQQTSCILFISLAYEAGRASAT